MALATFDQIKQFLELKKDSLDDYPNLSVLLNLTQKSFEKYCSREFDIKERTKKFRVSEDDGESIFWLEGTPVISVSSITVTDTSNTITPLTLNDDYFIFDTKIELTSPASKGSIVDIIYTGGIADQDSESTLLSTLPGDLNLAMIQQVSYQYQNRAKLAVTSIALDGNTTTLPGLILLPITRQTLDNYKNWGAGF